MNKRETDALTREYSLHVASPMYLPDEDRARPDIRPDGHWQRRLAWSDEELSVCNRLMNARVRSLAAHQQLRAHADSEDQLLIVRRGWLCRNRRTDATRSQVLSYILPGEVEYLIGQTDLADEPGDSDTIVTAVADTTVAVIERTELNTLRRRFPRVARALGLQLRVVQATQREWLINLGQRSGADRVAHLLCELFMRASVDAPVSGGSVRFPLTQAQIGEAAGLTPIHVNRILQGLRGSGTIEIRERRLTLLDLPKLTRAVGFVGDYLRLADLPCDPDAQPRWVVSPTVSMSEFALS